MSCSRAQLATLLGFFLSPLPLDGIVLFNSNFQSLGKHARRVAIARCVFFWLSTLLLVAAMASNKNDRGYGQNSEPPSGAQGPLVIGSSICWSVFVVLAIVSIVFNLLAWYRCTQV